MDNFGTRSGMWLVEQPPNGADSQTNNKKGCQKDLDRSGRLRLGVITHGRKAPLACGGNRNSNTDGPYPGHKQAHTGNAYADRNSSLLAKPVQYLALRRSRQPLRHQSSEH